MTGIFSSNRPDSYGGRDLYLVYFKDQITEQLMYTEDLPFVKYDTEEDLVLNDQTEVNVSSSSEDPADVATFTKKEFINSPLYYGSDEIILNPVNKGKMDRVKDLMVVYPELNITFSCHSNKEGMREFDLYFSIKRSEKAAEYLLKNGIAASRITVKGLGSNFPHTAQLGSQVNRLAEKNNRRIDIAFTNIPSDKLGIIEERPSVSEGLKDNTFETYYNTIPGLAYKIQVAQTKQMFKADVIRTYDSGIVEKNISDDSYTYTIGVFDSYNQARVLKSELLRKGILEAKVVPYVDDQAINSTQVQTLKEKYLDLSEYLKFESE